jgi:hypothetical protein
LGGGFVGLFEGGLDFAEGGGHGGRGVGGGGLSCCRVVGGEDVLVEDEREGAGV